MLARPSAALTHTFGQTRDFLLPVNVYKSGAGHSHTQPTEPSGPSTWRFGIGIDHRICHTPPFLYEYQRCLNLTSWASHFAPQALQAARASPSKDTVHATYSHSS